MLQNKEPHSAQSKLKPVNNCKNKAGSNTYIYIIMHSIHVLLLGNPRKPTHFRNLSVFAGLCQMFEELPGHPQLFICVLILSLGMFNWWKGVKHVIY